jgi:hypothetical protein
MRDAGPEEKGGGTRSNWLGMTRAPYTPRAARAVLSGTKCSSVQTLERLCGPMMDGARERKVTAPGLFPRSGARSLGEELVYEPF